jgi:hypothetical protein
MAGRWGLRYASRASNQQVCFFFQTGLEGGFIRRGCITSQAFFPLQAFMGGGWEVGDECTMAMETERKKEASKARS